MKSEHWLPWRFQMPLDISHEADQSTIPTLVVSQK